MMLRPDRAISFSWCAQVRDAQATRGGLAWGRGLSSLLHQVPPCKSPPPPHAAIQSQGLALGEHSRTLRPLLPCLGGGLQKADSRLWAARKYWLGRIFQTSAWSPESAPSSSLNPHSPHASLPTLLPPTFWVLRMGTVRAQVASSAGTSLSGIPACLSPFH